VISREEEKKLNELVLGGKKAGNYLCKKGGAAWRILRKELHTKNTRNCYKGNRKYNNQVIHSVAIGNEKKRMFHFI